MMKNNRWGRTVACLAVASVLGACAGSVPSTSSQILGSGDGGTDPWLAEILQYQELNYPDLDTVENPYSGLPPDQTTPIDFGSILPACQLPTGFAGPNALPDDITSIIEDGCFEESVNNFDCACGTPPGSPFFSGIQAEDDPAQLGGDAHVANIYVLYASRGANNRAATAIKFWALLNYYNLPTQMPTVPQDGSGNVEVLNNRVRSTLRTARRDGTPQMSITEWGDTEEVRMLGLWASMPPENFRNHTWPGGNFGGTDAQTRQRNQRDFSKFLMDKASTQQWQTFMEHAAFEVAVALKCGKPIFAHSGGGATLGFILRLLQYKFGGTITEWMQGHGPVAIVGLEMVFTDGLALDLINSDFSPYQHRITIQNVVAGNTGSATWRDPIVREIQGIGETPRRTDMVDPRRVNPGLIGAHGMVGFFVLENGNLPGVPFGGSP